MPAFSLRVCPHVQAVHLKVVFSVCVKRCLNTLNKQSQAQFLVRAQATTRTVQVKIFTVWFYLACENNQSWARKVRLFVKYVLLITVNSLAH